MEETNKNGWGGARPGAGRPKGSKDRVSIRDLLTALEAKTQGQTYEELLIEDFLTARLNNDTQLVQKYHHLLSNKVMNTLAAIEVTESESSVEAKSAAFTEALRRAMGNNNESN